MQPDPKPETTKVAAVLDKVATPDWRYLHKFWSVQLSMVWAVIGGLWIALPAFQSWLTPIPFACVCVAFSLLILLARATNQPGLPLL